MGDGPLKLLDLRLGARLKGSMNTTKLIRQTLA